GMQLTSVLRYLHSEGLAHLDLKPSNIICDAGIARLIDLSLALPIGTSGNTAGTHEYKAPEQITGAELTAATDVWGLGGILFRAVTGRRPFPRHRGGTGERHADDLPDLDLLETSTTDLRLARLIRECFAHEPQKRPSLDRIDAVLAGVVSSNEEWTEGKAGALSAH